MRYQPKISIIIAVKNAKELLQETLNSLRGQSYQALEVIVVDGVSEDGTLDVISKNQDLIKEYISESDQGISDAFNKGLKKAKGEYINFHGAGDTLYSKDSISQLFAYLDPSYHCICGQVLRVKEDGVSPLWVAPKRVYPFHPFSLLFKMSLPHQGLFTHRSFFEQWGEFDINLRFAMDYELLLRAYRQFPKTMIKPILVSKWRAGGVGKNKIKEVFDEYHRIKIKHQIAPLALLKAIDKWTRFKYWMKDKCFNLAY